MTQKPDTDRSYGPWEPWAKHFKPMYLKPNQRIQAVYINGFGELQSDADIGKDRAAGQTSWGFDKKLPSKVILAYRVKS